jgi:hypothetical protein
VTSRSAARRRAALGLGALVGALALAGCGGSTDPVPADAAVAPNGPAVDSASDAGSETAADGVPAALDFTAPLLGGGEIEMGTFAGRPVLLWFWAPW